MLVLGDSDDRMFNVASSYVSTLIYILRSRILPYSVDQFDLAQSSFLAHKHIYPHVLIQKLIALFLNVSIFYIFFPSVLPSSPAMGFMPFLFVFSNLRASN